MTVNPSLNPNFAEAVAKRLDVGTSWITLTLGLPTLISNEACLTNHAIAYLEYVKEPFGKDKVSFPKEIFASQKEVPTFLTAESKRVTPSIMYARELTIKGSPNTRTENVHLDIPNKQGQYERRQVLKYSYIDVTYYCTSISIHTYGIKLHHVWGIYPA